MEKISAVICELNPLHQGHTYLFQKAKENARCLIAIMSGNFVQRGECAVFDKYTRAAAAVHAGADLVVELPFPWCSGSAAFFARAGVHIAESIGCTHLYFGSETGDLQGLQLAARALCSREFQEGMRGALQAGVQREKLLARLCPGVSPAVFLGKNDILGAEYCRFLQKVIPMPIKRMDCTGATALRAAMAREILGTGENPKGAVLSHRLADLLFYFLRCVDTPPEGFAEGAGGVIRRLYNAAREAENEEDMFLRAATKQYTNARLRRSALFALTKTTLDMLRAQPTYTRVLAANAQGRACLAGLRKDEGQIQLITNHRGRNELSAQGRRQYLHGERADAIYTLCMEPPRPAGWFAAANPKMV